MPLEILESIIRINVLDDAKEENSTSEDHSNVDMQSVVKECVEQVLEVLKEKEER